MGFKSYARISDVQPMPNLIEVQLESFERFLEYGLLELFDEITPIQSFNKNLELHFPGTRNRELCEKFELGFRFGEPKYNVPECIERDITFSMPLYVKVLLYDRERDQAVVREIFFGDFPVMTDQGTFVINGTERVVVSQLIRSPGVYFDAEEDRATGRQLSTAKLIPDRGAWMEFETRKSDYLTIKFNRKRTVPVTIFLRALASLKTGDFETYFQDASMMAMFGPNPEFFSILNDGSDEELLALFTASDTHPQHKYIESTIKQEPVWELDKVTVAEEAALDFYKRMRPGDPLTLDNAKSFLISQMFDIRRYDLERVGRYKLNQRLGLDIGSVVRIVTKHDIVSLVEHMIRLNNGLEDPSDIDHLGNRRVKTVGELILQKLRVGLRRMERVVKERMSIRESEDMTPVDLINIRPVVASLREFFGSSQLSQFMEQTNPLSELTHKRTLSALGPGGLRRERAGFDVRDVHHSHYGRICPIETPEGPNIGLIGRLANFARVNEYGFVETPYRKVIRAAEPTVAALVGHTLRKRVVDGDGNMVAEADAEIDSTLAEQIVALGLQERISVVPMVTDEIEYLSADREDRYRIAQANAPLDERGHFVDDRVSVRYDQLFSFEAPDRIDYMDVSPKQIVGISAALIPFLEHDDANRALMGSNMQRQAVPLLQPQVPTVATGVEIQAARDSGYVIMSDVDGEVSSVQGTRVIVTDESGQEHTYELSRFRRSNQSTCLDQRPVARVGDLVHKGDVLVDSLSTDQGYLALGQNVLCAFISWEGANYEDAIIISEELVRADTFTSIHIEKHEIESRETKLGSEEITRDIPNVGEDALRDLDEFGVIRIGAEVGPNDILVGKITPKGEKELTPEEKLLRAIFGEKAREVKDSSLKMPHGESGRVVDVITFDREEHRDLPAGVNQLVRVSVAQRRKLTEGDKMAGRHGNKGVISCVVPIQDMPFLKDGTPIQIILNPLGVPGRMNIGQILETHLGWAAHRLGFKAITPVFDGASEQEIAAELMRAWMIDCAWNEITTRAWDWVQASEIDEEFYEDDNEARLDYIMEWLDKIGCEYDGEQLATDVAYARRIVLQEWLREKGVDPDELVDFAENAPPTDEAERRSNVVINGGLKLWLESIEQPVPDLEGEDLRDYVGQVFLKTGHCPPIFGKVRLYDGKTGEPFDQPVTIGIIHMMKLAHLVEDKVHARSTGPYSLVTQQPLGGKAQFGGQRFGEMEVWALEAYGAAYTLQEMLTIKSDDTVGRVKAYEAIVKGEPVEEVGVPASFRVLVKELQSLGLAVEAVGAGGEVIHFGKDEQQERVPRLSMGLQLLGGGGGLQSFRDDDL
ncbi:MAG: DNA-directed RNA polymerase subunit beta [Anaerolineae bacterium]|nr:DNA-directed RNA polymerase subunit beta [Anaerolineae bacterium]